MKESKIDRFRRVAEARVNKIIKMIRLLGNCSETGVYEYTDAQVEYIFSALQSELDKAKRRFREPLLGKHRFSLTDTNEFDDDSPLHTTMKFLFHHLLVVGHNTPFLFHKLRMLRNLILLLLVLFHD